MNITRLAARVSSYYTATAGITSLPAQALRAAFIEAIDTKGDAATQRARRHVDDLAGGVELGKGLALLFVDLVTLPTVIACQLPAFPLSVGCALVAENIEDKKGMMAAIAREGLDMGRRLSVHLAPRIASVEETIRRHGLD